MVDEVQYIAYLLTDSKLYQQYIAWWVNVVYDVNTLRPRQDGRYFADDVLKCFFFNENMLISLKIPLKFFPKGPINNISAFVQIMAWRRPGDKPLSEPIIVFIPTHICVTRPQWVKSWCKHGFLGYLSILITFCFLWFPYLKDCNSKLFALQECLPLCIIIAM